MPIPVLSDFISSTIRRLFLGIIPSNGAACHTPTSNQLTRQPLSARKCSGTIPKLTNILGIFYLPPAFGNFNKGGRDA
jgi:hypothetical protein